MTRDSLMMATLKEYRFSRDAGREKPAPTDADLEEIPSPAGPRPGVVGAIEKAREAAAAKGPGGAHDKVKDKGGKAYDARLKFGRHKGKLLSEIKEIDPSYIAFLVAREFHPETRPDGFPKDLVEIARLFA